MTKKTNFNGRKFQLWRYTVTHNVLMLVSTKDMGYETRICVLFAGVEFLELATMMSIDEIREPSDAGEELRRYEIISGERTFAISAEFMQVEEDFGDYNAANIYDRYFSLKD